MAPLVTALRRATFLLLLAVGIGAVVSSWRGRSATPAPAAPPQWPPWEQESEAPAREPQESARPNSAVAPASEQTWLPAPGDGSVPEGHPIKVKLSSGIFHVPGGRFYERTRADRCYPTAAAAEADGYRRSKT